MLELSSKKGGNVVVENCATKIFKVDEEKSLMWLIISCSSFLLGAQSAMASRCTELYPGTILASSYGVLWSTVISSFLVGSLLYALYLSASYSSFLCGALSKLQAATVCPVSSYYQIYALLPVQHFLLLF